MEKLSAKSSDGFKAAERAIEQVILGMNLKDNKRGFN